MHTLYMTLLMLALLPLPGGSNEVPLFAIQRSKNANQVEYRLRVDNRCQLLSAAPITVVWKMLADHPGKTEPLTDLEHRAYGAVKQQIADNWVSFDLGLLDHFRPLDQRRIKVTAVYDPSKATCVPIVHTAINGQVAALERIYIQAEEGTLKPKVLYIDIFGKSVEATPTPMQERITP